MVRDRILLSVEQEFREAKAEMLLLVNKSFLSDAGKQGWSLCSGEGGHFKSARVGCFDQLFQ